MVTCFAKVGVVAVREGLPGPEVQLVLRRNVLTGELKTYLSNTPTTTPLAALVWLSGVHQPIETSFEDRKQYLEMGAQKVREWHQHMTFVILAHFFSSGCGSG